LLGRKRSDMMPPITGREELVVGFDRWMFTLIFGSEWLLATGFVLAIFLGFARVALVMPLAVLGAFLERRRVFDPDYQPFVSVLIAAYNEAPVIERTISSILNSSYTNLEVVVVDDGSQDGTGEVVQRVFGSDSRVVIRRQTNGGKASALNRAIAESHGEIFVGFDADTQVAADAIALLVRHFHNPKVGAVAGNVKVGNRVNLITRWQALEYVTSQNLDRRAYGVLNAITVVPGAIGAWRRSAVLGVGGYMADTLAEDMDLTWRLRRAGWRLETDTQAMAYTEAPDTFGAFFKQRFRWTYGTLQCLYKHRKALGRYGWFGWLALPQIWIFQIILQVLAPFVDFQLLYGLLGVATSWLAQGYYHDIWQPDQSSVALLQRTAFFYAVFYCCELLGSALAFRLDRERWSLLLWLFWQRFVYRQLLYGVVWKALWTALIGFRQGWGKLARKGTVNLPVARTASPAPREEGT